MTTKILSISEALIKMMFTVKCQSLSESHFCVKKTEGTPTNLAADTSWMR